MTRPGSRVPRGPAPRARRVAPGRRHLRAALALGLLHGATPSAAAQADARPARPSLEEYDFASPDAWTELPARLREISGLASTPDGRLFAHDDESAVIYEIDPSAGRPLKAWALGEVTVRGDFEGLAVAGDRFFLVSSDGRLYEAVEGGDGERVGFHLHETGVGRRCEVEGLAHDPVGRALVLACKTPRDRGLAGFVALFRWSLDRRRTEARVTLISIASLAEGIPGRGFHPSGIERHPERGTYFLVAARENAIAEVTRSGLVRAVAALPGRAHRQAEGVTFGPGGALYLADEGGNRRGRLTRYLPRAPGGPAPGGPASESPATESPASEGPASESPPPRPDL